MKRIEGLLVGWLWAGLVWAHGGLSMEQDMCKLTVGPYMMHFAGYQEDAQRTEFCEDIPHKGPTIVVLDMVDPALRDMPVEFRIVRKFVVGARWFGHGTRHVQTHRRPLHDAFRRLSRRRATN